MFWVSDFVNVILIHIVKVYIDEKDWKEVQHTKIKIKKLIYFVQLHLRNILKEILFKPFYVIGMKMYVPRT